MKEQGLQDNPEYTKAYNLLQAIKHHQDLNTSHNLKQPRRTQATQLEPSGQPSVMNGKDGINVLVHPVVSNADYLSSAHVSNVRSGVLPNELNAEPHKMSRSQDSPSGVNALGEINKSHASEPISDEQLAILRTQILAFRLLSRNLSVPTNIQQQLFKSQQSKRPPPTAQALSAASQVIDNASKEIETPKKVLSPPRAPHVYEKFRDPWEYLKPAISYPDHSIRKSRIMIPSILPTGVDIDRVREERDRIAYNRVLSRQQELSETDANVAAWNTKRGDHSKVNHPLKLNAVMEFKMLSLVTKQRNIRQQVMHEVMHYDNVAQTANRSIYRRMKKQSLREARITEKLEKQQRDARETKEKQKQTDHLQSILQHGSEIHKNAVAQRARMQKLGRMMLQQHQSIEKEEQKRVERTAKQRLQALKANDEVTYLKLLGQAKDSRISHLLKQTDGFLNQLAASVKQQQRNAAQYYGEEQPPDEDISDGEDDVEGGPKVDYYQVAHRIKEEVKQQPNLLIGGTLKEYQLKGLQWMISLYNNNLNGLLADEMGLGKTIQTISLITYLIEKKKQNGPFLVIVPLSTLTNWNLEFEKWAPAVRRVVYKGPPTTRKQQQQQIRLGNFQVLLTTYEYIIKDRPILSKIKWVHMIVDEGHRMKNAQSKLSSTLTQYYTSRFRLILTGTPLQNNLPELWALLNFVLPTIFKSVKSFDEWFNTPFANTGGQDKMELTEEEQLLVIRRLHKVLRPFLLRRLKKDVEKDLPDKQESVIKCKFSALQAKLYKQLVTYNKMSVSDGKGGKTGMRGLSNMLMQLRKLCNHPFVFEQVEEQMNPDKATNDMIWRSAGKFELLDRILPKFKASGHRVLMFFQMTQIMNIMEDFLRLRGLKYLRLDGSTKSDDRSDLLSKFNSSASPYFCFLLSTRAGGLGLNLQTADTVIIFDSDWNPHQDLQAQDRAHRIGQKNEVRILRLISSNSVEEKILERAQYKLDMDGKVIQAGKFDNKSTAEERDALLRTLLDSAEAAEQLEEQEEMDDEYLNGIMARSDEEMLIFQKLDEERAKDPDYGPDPKLPRLMAENELPEIYLQEDNPVTEEIEELAGRGARERTRVKYDDGLTEEQWLMAVDDDEDTIEAAVARRNAKIEKRNANKEKRARQASGKDSSPEPSRESSEVPAPKKRNRKANGTKRKAEDEIDEVPASKRKRNGKQSKIVDTLTVAQRSILQKSLNAVYQHLMHLEVDIPGESSEDDDEDGPLKRGIIDPFVKLVPKAQYPDYYIIITNPVAMDIIKKKINKEDYQSPKEFLDDIRLLCTNARTYNEDGSMLFQDANDIEVGLNSDFYFDMRVLLTFSQAACIAKLKEEIEAHPELQDFEDSSYTPIDGRSTAAVSSVGTPLTSGANSGQTKLKLTFNGGKEGYANGDNGQHTDDD